MSGRLLYSVAEVVAAGKRTGPAASVPRGGRPVRRPEASLPAAVPPDLSPRPGPARRPPPPAVRLRDWIAPLPRPPPHPWRLIAGLPWPGWALLKDGGLFPPARTTSAPLAFQRECFFSDDIGSVCYSGPHQACVGLSSRALREPLTERCSSVELVAHDLGNRSSAWRFGPDGLRAYLASPSVPGWGGAIRVSNSLEQGSEFFQGVNRKSHAPFRHPPGLRRTPWQTTASSTFTASGGRAKNIDESILINMIPAAPRSQTHNLHGIATISLFSPCRVCGGPFPKK
jgi:hypothetical protein